MKAATTDRLTLLEDIQDMFLEAKDDTRLALVIEDDVDPVMKIQKSGKVYKRLQKMGLLHTRYRYTNRSR